MEELGVKHRKEQRDLQSQITQKKKSANKKSRKAVNEECARLEQELQERQEREVSFLNGRNAGDGVDSNGVTEEQDASQADLLDSIATETSLVGQTEKMSISGSAAEGSSIHLSQQQKKPNRQKARLARRAAEQEAAAEAAAQEAANMPDLKQQERERMIETFKQKGLEEKEIAANGHCMYSAVADQMRQLGYGLEASADSQSSAQPGQLTSSDYKTVRVVTANYISEHPDDFTPFLEEPLDDYVHKVRETAEWGGQLELLALAKAYNVNINVLQSEGRTEKVEGDSTASPKEIWLAYYRHGFGLGEHYNSLRKRKLEAAID